MNKAIIVSAPSGAGKTTIVKHLLKELPQLSFSVSACSRPKRETETDGKDYYFISAGEFRKKIEKDEFVEWQEVYPGSFYGTLKSELERIWQRGMTPIFDVDVEGGTNLKKYFGEKALLLFIVPPSPEELEKRLRLRSTETEESLRKRLGKAAFELDFQKYADRIVVNQHIETAYKEASDIVKNFIHSSPQ
jgi:guanylate kinase